MSCSFFFLMSEDFLSSADVKGEHRARNVAGPQDVEQQSCCCVSPCLRCNLILAVKTVSGEPKLTFAG